MSSSVSIQVLPGSEREQTHGKGLQQSLFQTEIGREVFQLAAQR